MKLNRYILELIKEFHTKILGGVKMSNINEEKKFNLPVDEKESEFNFLTHTNHWYGGYLRAWSRVSERADRYARARNLGDDWFPRRLVGSTHRALGLALRVFDINTNRGWVNGSIEYRNHQWNRLLNKYNNALARVILTLVLARGRNIQLKKCLNEDFPLIACVESLRLHSHYYLTRIFQTQQHPQK